VRAGPLAVRIVATLLCGAVVGACAAAVGEEVRRGFWELGAGIYSYTDAELEDAQAELVGRVPFEEVRGSGSAALDEIRAALDAELGPISWTASPVASTDYPGCTELEMDAAGAALDDAVLSEVARATGSVVLDPQQSARAVEIVADQARNLGFTRADSYPSSSGFHGEMRSERGGSVSVNVEEGSVEVGVVTDCYLTASGLAELS
jgi:hypothetical protein